MPRYIPRDSPHHGPYVGINGGAAAPGACPVSKGPQLVAISAGSGGFYDV